MLIDALAIAFHFQCFVLKKELKRIYHWERFVC